MMASSTVVRRRDTSSSSNNSHAHRPSVVVPLLQHQHHQHSSDTSSSSNNNHDSSDNDGIDSADITIPLHPLDIVLAAPQQGQDPTSTSTSTSAVTRQAAAVVAQSMSRLDHFVRQSMVDLWSFKAGGQRRQLARGMRCAMIVGLLLLLMLVPLLALYWTVDAYLMSLAAAALHRQVAAPAPAPPAAGLRVVVGVGEMKTGTTYFGNALHVTSRLLQNDDEINKRSYAFVPPYKHGNSETKYWSECIFQESSVLRHVVSTREDGLCNWSDYISSQWKAASSSSSSSSGDPVVVLLSEKTPNYMSQPHSSMLLATYAQLVDTKMYVIVRDPMARLWSHYFFSCRSAAAGDGDGDGDGDGEGLDYCSRQAVMARMTREIEAYDSGSDQMGKVTALVRGVVGVGVGVGVGVDGVQDGSAKWQKMLRKEYVRQFYRMFISRMLMFGGQDDDPKVFKSCYYPHLLLFYHYLVSDRFTAAASGVEEVSVAGKFKIIQQEWFSQDASKVLWKFKCWALAPSSSSRSRSRKNDDECDEVELRERKLYVDLEESSIRQMIRGGVHPHPKMTDAVHDKFFPVFEACNNRLYQFLEQHPELLLQVEGMPFQKWNLRQKR